MKIAKIISLIGLAAMTVAILNAILNGNFAEEGAWIISHPWGVTSLVDLYVGLSSSRCGSCIVRSRC